MHSSQPMWRPMRPAGSLTARIAGHVRELIAAGELRPGDRLPGERELANLLGVSRSSVREAVQSLAALGVVSVRHGQGVFVAPAGAQPAGGVEASRQWIGEFYAMREALEGPAARWAAWNATPTPQALTTLEQTHDRLAAAIHLPPEEYWRLNTAFHETVARLAGNRPLLDTLHALNQAAAAGLPALAPAPSRQAPWPAGHTAILEAVKAGDARGAERAARAHIRAAYRAVLRHSAR